MQDMGANDIFAAENNPDAEKLMALDGEQVRGKGYEEEWMNLMLKDLSVVDCDSIQVVGALPGRFIGRLLSILGGTEGDTGYGCLCLWDMPVRGRDPGNRYLRHVRATELWLSSDRVERERSVGQEKLRSRTQKGRNATGS